MLGKNQLFQTLEDGVESQFVHGVALVCTHESDRNSCVTNEKQARERTSNPASRHFPCKYNSKYSKMLLSLLISQHREQVWTLFKLDTR